MKLFVQKTMTGITTAPPISHTTYVAELIPAQAFYQIAPITLFYLIPTHPTRNRVFVDPMERELIHFTVMGRAAASLGWNVRPNIFRMSSLPMVL
jgi:hypothetical protein